MRLLVTDAAAQPPRQATAWLIMTLVISNHIEPRGRILIRHQPTQTIPISNSPKYNEPYSEADFLRMMQNRGGEDSEPEYNRTVETK